MKYFQFYLSSLTYIFSSVIRRIALVAEGQKIKIRTYQDKGVFLIIRGLQVRGGFLLN